MAEYCRRADLQAPPSASDPPHPMCPSDDPASTTASSAWSLSRPSSASSALSTTPPSSLRAGPPASPLFEIRDTPTAGRAVFATRDMARGTLIWRSEDLTLSVLLREYRREVCGQCFRYDFGRDLPIRDATVGFAFCSRECHELWTQWNGTLGVQAWTAVEAFVKKRSREDADMVEAELPRPTSNDIRTAWGHVDAQASLIRAARQAECPTSLPLPDAETKDDKPVPVTKQHRKAIQKALQQKISPDVMSFIVSGIVWRHSAPSDWGTVLALAEDNTPYHSVDDLQAFVRSYLHLVAILPLQLLPLVTAETLFLFSSRDSHNSFGIRSLEDDGSEFFGFGCWPAASYFNHSCGPNVDKAREGRAWCFRAGCDIAKGEELNITYLSGEERKLGREERMQRLRKNWGFECGCTRCAA